MSLKCYKSASTSSDCLSSKAKYCAKITVILFDNSTRTTYSCKEEPQIDLRNGAILGLDKSTIKETLACYNRTVDPKFDPKVEMKGEYCFCSTDNCNDPNVTTLNTLEKSPPLKVINFQLRFSMY